MINYPDGRKYRRTERSDDQDDVKSKYHAEKVTVDGIRFDSKKEANRYRQLRIMERAGTIIGLRV